MKPTTILRFCFALSALTLIVTGLPQQSVAEQNDMITLSLAEDYIPSEWTVPPTYKEQVTEKLGYGITNTFLGWMDLFLEPAEAAANRRNVFKGMWFGVKDGFENTVGGLVHLFTFPITRLDLALPEDGIDLKA